MTKTRFTSPVGRLVQGSVDEPQTKDAQGNLRVVKSGPNAGQPNPQFFGAVAIAKNDPAWPAFWAELVNAAYAGFPTLFPHGVQAIIDAQGPQPWFFQAPAGHAQAWVMHPQFTFKVIDGDSPLPNQNGRVWNTIEGFAGHWVVRFGTSYPPRCYHAGRYAPNEQIQEKNVIRRGYYVRVSGTVEGNGNAQKPGLYVNWDMVELSAYGQEIATGPDANAAFGGGPAALPPGATAAPQTPPAPAPGAPPAGPIPPAVAPPAATPYPAAALPAPASPAPPVQPYAGYMAPPAPGAPPAGPTPAAPAPVAAPAPATPAAPPPAPISPPIASPTRVMLPAAGGHTYEAMIAAGWTDDTLRANGYMQ